MARQEGYYFVKMPSDDVNPGWKIALWHDNNGGDDPDWCWHSSAFNTKHYDNFFDEIDERPIIRRDSLPKAFNIKKGMGFERHLLENYYVALLSYLCLIGKQ